MNYNISEQLSILDEKKMKIKSIVNEMDDKTQEYEKEMKCLSDKIINKRKEVDEIESKIVTIRLGDLIDELSWLSGNDACDIETSIKFSMDFNSMEDFFEFIDEIQDTGKNCLISNVRFEIKCKKKKNNDESISFDYFTFMDFNLGMVQSSGYLLINHGLCSFESYTTTDEITVNFSLEKNRDDILCNFKLGDLNKENNYSWYPADLFIQAIFNINKREYDKNVDKIRSKKM